MPLSAKSDAAQSAPHGAEAHWEQRSSHRVLEARRDQILERSRQIVDAAYELLEEEGLEGLTIRAVLTRTGLSRRAFYERFADKAAIVGVGYTDFSRASGRTVLALALEAIGKALADAGLERAAVDGILSYSLGDSVPVAYIGGAFRSEMLLERFRSLVELEAGSRCGSPVYGPAEGALLEAYRAAGLSSADVERGRYTRISHIQRLINSGRLDSSLRWTKQLAETAAVA